MISIIPGALYPNKTQKMLRRIHPSVSNFGMNFSFRCGPWFHIARRRSHERSVLPVGTSQDFLALQPLS
jgi:hypothetical protein